MTTENPQPNTPSKEQILAFLSEQIEVKTLQLQVQQLTTSIVQSRADEYEALTKLKQYSPGLTNENNTDNENIVKHTITELDIENNPEFAAQGMKAGDTVGIPKDVFSQLNLETSPAAELILVDAE